MLKERKKLEIILLLAVAAVCMGMFFFRGRKYESLNINKAEMLPSVPAEFKLSGNTGSNYVEHEVICRVDSEEDAKRVAEAVEGSLKSWQEGIAVIEIEETVREFLKKYQGNTELPAMYPNYVYSIKY